MESEMTQPAKAQEPSMEEILASIRRIIADDEAKPATPAPAPVAVAPKPEPPKPAPPPSKPAAMTPPPSAPSPVAQAAPPKPAAAAPKPAPAESNSQDDIDALLAGLDADTTEEEVRPPQPDGDVLELTDEMALPEPEPEPAPPPPPPPPVQKAPIEDDIEFAEAAPKPRAPEPAYEPPPAAAAWSEEPQQPILSRTTAAAVESAFNSLATTVLSNNARTLEDLVKEMLRPMLKAWLDDNLPTLVERIVRQEIERVSRGR
ncbi:PopZ family protein [Rhodopseudomonas palustris]|uniref:PopZ family protein n=1 Tax=Rhodopseudomonas palustris TaxID=1076 RepID=UPI0039B6EC05